MIFELMRRQGHGSDHAADRRLEILRQRLHHFDRARLRAPPLVLALVALRLRGLAQATLEGVDGAGHFAQFILAVEARQLDVVIALRHLAQAVVMSRQPREIVMADEPGEADEQRQQRRDHQRDPRDDAEYLAENVVQINAGANHQPEFGNRQHIRRLLGRFLVVAAVARLFPVIDRIAAALGPGLSQHLAEGKPPSASLMSSRLLPSSSGVAGESRETPSKSMAKK